MSARRFVLALSAGLAFGIGPAGAQNPQTATHLSSVHPVCGDGSQGATVVSQSPVSPNDGSLGYVLLYRSGPVGDTYVNGLKLLQNAGRTDTVAGAQALQKSQYAMVNAMQLLYQNGRFAQADERGTIVCGDVPPGRYDLLATVTNTSDASSGGSGVRYYISHVTVPKVQGRRVIVRALRFTAL